jgi:opacity protein-like surface antigen
MKKILLVAVFAVAALTVSAQTEDEAKAQAAKEQKVRFSVGIDAGLPVGEAGDFYGSVLGGVAKLEVPLKTSLFATVSLGYSVLSFSDEGKAFQESFNSSTEAEGYMPIKAGLRYYFNKNIYGAAEIGSALAIKANSSTGFAWAPGVGVSYPVWRNHEIDAGLRYESWSQSTGNVDQIGLHVAFKF